MPSISTVFRPILTSVLRRGVPFTSFSPRDLFNSGEIGAWYEVAPAYLFQDSTGTTPVTAAGQNIGLHVDLSRQLSLSSELANNGEFVTDTVWAKGAGWAIAGGKATATNASSYLYQIGGMPANIAAGRVYKVVYNVSNYTSGSVKPYIHASPVFGQIASSTGTFTAYICANATSRELGFLGTAFSGDIEFISVKEVFGYHARQAGSTLRPVYQIGPSRIDFDGADDVLTTSFFGDLGSNCTVARAVPSVGASILVGQTIGTSFTDSTDHAGLVIVNRALTSREIAGLTAYLNQKAGV